MPKVNKDATLMIFFPIASKSLVPANASIVHVMIFQTDRLNPLFHNPHLRIPRFGNLLHCLPLSCLNIMHNSVLVGSGAQSWVEP